jgi:hypothetical protein
MMMLMPGKNLQGANSETGICPVSFFIFEMKYWIKILSACLLSWLFLASILLLMSGLEILGTGTDIGSLLITLLLAFVACYGMAWVNTASLQRALLGAAGGILIGVPLALLVFIPFSNWISNLLFPLSNLPLSGSLVMSWIFLSVIATIEMLTEHLFSNKRWLLLLAGSLAVILLIFILELATQRFGYSTNTSFIKLILFAPLIWGGIVAFVNIPSLNQNHPEQGGMNETHT